MDSCRSISHRGQASGPPLQVLSDSSECRRSHAGEPGDDVGRAEQGDAPLGVSTPPHLHAIISTPGETSLQVGYRPLEWTNQRTLGSLRPAGAGAPLVWWGNPDPQQPIISRRTSQPPSQPPNPESILESVRTPYNPSQPEQHSTQLRHAHLRHAHNALDWTYLALTRARVLWLSEWCPPPGALVPAPEQAYRNTHNTNNRRPSQRDT